MNKQVFRVAEVPIEWEEHFVGTEIDPRTQSFLTWESLESVRQNKVGLKGPMATPIGKGHRSLNLTLRKELNLYANVRPCYSLPGYKTKYDNVDLVTIRENTEGEYSGLEHQVSLHMHIDYLKATDMFSIQANPFCFPSRWLGVLLKV